jgi:hypothetical protein
MKYKVEISGGLLGMKSTLEGELTAKNSILKKALLAEKRLIDLNPNNGSGYKYTFTIEKGRNMTQEYYFDETTIKGSFKELLSVAEVDAKVYQ